MNKNLLKELILPAFWLFFFIVFSKNDGKSINIKADNTELKKQQIQSISGSGESNTSNKNQEVMSTKAIYLSGF